MATQTGFISTRRIRNSTNGNPRYEVHFKADGELTAPRIGKTASDSQFAYSMPTNGRVTVDYHVTPAGRTTFTNIVRLALETKPDPESEVVRLRAALQRIADGNVMSGKPWTHLETVVAYQTLARAALV